MQASALCWVLIRLRLLLVFFCPISKSQSTFIPGDGISCENAWYLFPFALVNMFLFHALNFVLGSCHLTRQHLSYSSVCCL